MLVVRHQKAWPKTLGFVLAVPIVQALGTQSEWACSGPHALETILANEHLGWATWFASCAAVVGFAVERILRLRTWHGIGVPALLVGVHPGWWMSARSGDCGYLVRHASEATSAVIVVVLAVLLWRRMAKKPRTELTKLETAGVWVLVLAGFGVAAFLP
ncbi:MAG: hypothetical protein JST54_28490 [Deltaproteobacteria bacterium]|nr:hypothetical protein [Deltaproteobacteria bacterium]